MYERNDKNLADNKYAMLWGGTQSTHICLSRILTLLHAECDRTDYVCAVSRCLKSKQKIESAKNARIDRMVWLVGELDAAAFLVASHAHTHSQFQADKYLNMQNCNMFAILSCFSNQILLIKLISL